MIRFYKELNAEKQDPSSRYIGAYEWNFYSVGCIILIFDSWAMSSIVRITKLSYNINNYI